MSKWLVIHVALIWCIQITAQNTVPIECIYEPDEEWAALRYQIGNESTQENGPTIHYLRVNIHYMLRSDSTGNFTPTHDNNGLPYSGYIHATELVEACNGRQSWNQKMNIPAGNSTPHPNKNYYYILDGVYFHYDNNLYTYPSMQGTSTFYTVGEKTDSVINIFLTNNTGFALGSGYASSLNPNSKIKYSENRNFWHSYLDWRNVGYPKEFMWHGQGSQTHS